MSLAATSPRDVEVVTFGCRLNACESETLAAEARADGLTDTVVFNTCAVTGEAVRQARQAIRKARRERPTARLVATGCAVQTDPSAFAAMPELDLVLGNAAKGRPGALAVTGPRMRVSDIFAPGHGLSPASGVFGGRARAYVEIQNGCDHRCTFCVIPFGRGNARSTPAEAVVARVRDLVEAGFAEVVLTGVDLTSWGTDLGRGEALGDLVSRILREIPALPRLRLSSIDAAEIDRALMTALAEEARLAPHLHLSLQSGDDMILKRMKRRHSRADALALVQAVRRVRPDVAFGADLIAGFPTESEAAFENSLNLVEDAGISFLHVFPFSPRPGTPAARMPQLPSAAIKERAARLRAAAEAALARRLTVRLGSTARALVEAPGRARDADYLEIAFGGDAPVGSLIAGRVASHDGRRGHLAAWRGLPPGPLLG
jgi:threonylcarbamoyladenosine tRNA methylthiotransferase MtaB